MFVLFICWVMNESIQPNTVLMPFWIACKGATMSAPMTVNTLTMKSRIPLNIVVAVVLMPFQTPDRNEVIDVHALVMPPLIADHRLARNSPSPVPYRLSALHERGPMSSDSHEVNAAPCLAPGLSLG